MSALIIFTSSPPSLLQRILAARDDLSFSGKGGGGEGCWAPASSSVSQQSAHVSKAAATPQRAGLRACVCESVFVFFFHFHKSRFRLKWLAWGLMIRSTSILQPQVDDLQGTRARSEAPAQAWIPCGHGKPQRPRGLSTSTSVLVAGLG